MYVTGGWTTASPNMGYDVKFTPIVGMSVNIPVLRWGARFKTNRQQKAYTGIQKLQQSYVVDQINQELAAALTKLQETEEQVKTAKENKELAEENLRLVFFGDTFQQQNTERLSANKRKLYFIQTEALFRVNRASVSYIRSLYSAKS